MIKVSVIIPVYNMEQYVEQCMDSVCGQTLEEIEILCLDDGSTDKSLEILQRYQISDARVKVITQPNQGVSKTRNQGIQQAQGKYVIFMDPDDWYPNKDVLEKLYLSAEEHQVKIAGGSFMDYHDGIYNEEFEERYFGYHFEKEGVIDYSEYQFDFGYQRFIFEKDMLLENKIFFKEYVRYQDPPFLVEAMICAGRFYGMNYPTYCYRYGHDHVSWNSRKVCDMLKGIQDNLDISRKHGLKRLHQLCVVRLNEEYRQLLGDSIFYEDYAVEVFEAMMETFLHIDKTLLDENNADLTKIFSPIVERIRFDVENQNDYVQYLQDKNKRVSEEISHLKIAMQYIDNDRKYLENDNRAVYESFSYRFGHKITSIPRWFYRKLRGK